MFGKTLKLWQKNYPEFWETAIAHSTVGIKFESRYVGNGWIIEIFVTAQP